VIQGNGQILEGPLMWGQENRPKYNRDKLRYPSDLTDEEWSFIEPLIPPSKHGGRQRSVNIREIVNGLMYILSTGGQWRYIPKDLPPKSTIHDYSACGIGMARSVASSRAYVKCRERASHEASPTACVIDSQSVKSVEKGRRVSTRRAMTRAKRSRARSTISSSAL